MLSHLTNLRPKFPFFSSFEVNRFSGAVRGQSVHRVIGTGPYTGHGERGADEEVDISPERKKQRNCSRGRRTRRWGKETEELLDLLDAFVCQMEKRRRGSYIDDLPHCI